MTNQETIFALATPAGKAALALIRISGPAARVGVAAIGAHPLTHAHMKRVRLKDPQTGDDLDDAMAVLFEAPKSSTGEAVVELTIHGGPLVYQSVLRALSTLPGFRPAEPGEFSRRAFLNGKLDLSAAEGLQDLIDATSERQRQIALRQLTGGSADRIGAWRETLVAAMAHLEAWIDFPDEDLPPDLLAGFADDLGALSSEIMFHVKQSIVGERIRDGFEIAILGAPNVGKSSLLNRLAKRDVAITTPIAGTTRDVLEVHMEIDGYAVTLIDTAGLREAAGDEIEAEGIRRALNRGHEADAVLWLVEAEGLDAPGSPNPLDFSVSQLGDIATTSQHTIYIANKVDLAQGSINAPWIPVSAKTGEGIDRLQSALAETLRMIAGEKSADIIFTKERHRKALEQTLTHLNHASEEIDRGSGLEIIAEDLRLGARALGRVTGVVDIEDILDRIFADFCLGK